MKLQEAKAQDILGFHRVSLLRHSCDTVESSSPQCKCYDELSDDTLAYIYDYEQNSGRWFVIAVRFEHRVAGVCSSLFTAEEWRQQMDMDNLDEEFFVVAPGRVFPLMTGDISIVDEGGRQFDFVHGHIGVTFDPAVPNDLLNPLGKPGRTDEFDINSPLDLLNRLAAFLGYQAGPRSLTPVDRPVDPSKWYAVDRETNVRLQEYNNEAEAVAGIRGNDPNRFQISILPGPVLMPPSETTLSDSKPSEPPF